MQNRMAQTMAPIKDMMNVMRNSSNPQALLQQMAMQNPRVKMVMDYINRNGGNGRDAFYQMANEQGVDPESILSQLR